MPTLTKTQRNDVLARVTASGLDPRDFTWGTERTADWTGFNGYAADALAHSPTGYYALFFAPGAVGLSYLSNVPQLRLTRPGEYVVAFEPGTESPRGKVIGVAWPNLLDAVALWLALVKREHDAPDLWADLAAIAPPALNVLLVHVEEPNAPFTPPERERLAKSLDDIRDQLAALYDLTAEQIGVMNSGFAELHGASGRLGKRDWKGILINWLLSIATTAGFAPDARRALFDLAGRALRWLIEHGRLLGP